MGVTQQNDQEKVTLSNPALDTPPPLNPGVYDSMDALS